MAVKRNVLVILAMVSCQRIHISICFFLTNLSYFENLYMLKVMPKMLEDFLQEAFISMAGSFIQFLIFGSPGTADALVG
ncbi:Olfactory receptor 11A1 [Camelus dromedarius]|uniref:Olfactory receptor 11A1 n=1 Tax=Camelus dromedarius TaxID=9838 RepID=A0A5N4CQN5_CAMDR|nr:Olfactory receptor 11A1 [Camelus dromedarius]